MFFLVTIHSFTCGVAGKYGLGRVCFAGSWFGIEIEEYRKPICCYYFRIEGLFQLVGIERVTGRNDRVSWIFIG